MMRYVLIVALIGVTFSEAYKTKTKHPKRQEYFKFEPAYGDISGYDLPIYAKDVDAENEHPTIFSYWNALLRRTRLPSWNITNPFSKLFRPYVIKVDFPPGTDPNDTPAPSPPPPTGNRNKEKQPDDYVYLNVDSENAQFFYDPVTQQYYEVQESASHDYDPQSHYYATTFNDDDEVVIDLAKDTNKDGSEYVVGDDDEEVVYSGIIRNDGYLGKYNSPALKQLKTKHQSPRRRKHGNNRKPLKHSKKRTRLASA